MTLTSNKDYLSQEEIDALLRHSSEENSEFEASLQGAGDSASLSIDDYLTTLEQDALGEIGNITFGSAATALSTLLGRKVEITTPKVSAVSKMRLEEEFPIPHVAVHVKYVEGLQGINLLVIKTTDAKVIADLMLGGDGMNIGGELNEIHISAVQEAMNQMMGSSATSMSTIFNRMVNISPPGINILDVASGEGVSQLPDDDVLVKISFRLTIGDLIDSTIMQLIPVPFAKELVAGLMGGSTMGTETDSPKSSESAGAQAMSGTHGTAPDSAGQPANQPPHMQPAAGPQGYAPPPYQQPYTQAPYQQPPYQHAYTQAPYQQAGYPPQYPPHTPPIDYAQASMMQPPPPPSFQRNVNVEPVQYAPFGENPGVHATEPNLNLLLDIPLKVTVELGRTKKQIKEILELSQGSIIELDKLAGEPVDILVNNKLIAKGEVVVIDENFGVRVTDIVSPTDRIHRIQ
jgi:flagellar motor switch protein FliN/FliY